MKSIGVFKSGFNKKIVSLVFNSDFYTRQNLNRTFILIYAKAWDNIKVKIRHISIVKLCGESFFAIIRYIRIN